MAVAAAIAVTVPAGAARAWAAVVPAVVESSGSVSGASSFGEMIARTFTRTAAVTVDSLAVFDRNPLGTASDGLANPVPVGPSRAADGSPTGRRSPASSSQPALAARSSATSGPSTWARPRR